MTGAADTSSTPVEGDRAQTGDPAKARRRHRAPGITLDCGAGPDVRHVGIAFVHGIGTQQAGETLLDWGGAMIRVLLDVRARHEASADPVIATHLEPGPGESRYVELQLPAVILADGTKVPEQHWVMTEAWWAQRVRPPSFGQMAEWLGPRGAIRRILTALLPRRRGEHDPRLRPWVVPYPLRRDPSGRVEEAAAAGAPMGMKEAPVRGAVAVYGGGLYLQAVSALLLVLYGLLRSIEKLLPIGPLKDGALTRPLDQFVLDWFGDVYVLLSDPAQAASIRGRLVDALDDLKAARCDEIAVVAHSGGAIVTYMTLADMPATRLKVDRLVTLGEGLNLAWRLLAGDEGHGEEDAAVQSDRLYKRVLAAHPDLHWDDFWASQDPAPVGVLEFPAAPRGGDDALDRVRSHSTWNRLSFSDDHGGYWDNDEEFLIPMLRLLEGRAGGGALLGSEADDQERSNRRRRRLSLLSLWRQLSVVAPMAGIVVAFALGSSFVVHAADAVAGLLGAIPGSGVVTGPLATLRGLALEDTVPGRLLGETGVWLVAASIAGTAAFALIAPPERPLPWANGRYGKWIERGLRVVPWLAGVPVLIALGYGALRFVGGSTPEAMDVGRTVGIAAVVVAILAFVVPLALGRQDGDRAALRRGLDIVLTMLAMVVVGALVAAPVVAVVVFPDVGRTVLGSLAVLLAFQALGRVGGWRWSVWDARERVAARTAREYPGVWRVVVQVGILFAGLVALFLAVVLDSVLALGAAAVGTVVAVLLGVAIDVLDATRQGQVSPAESLRRHQARGA